MSANLASAKVRLDFDAERQSVWDSLINHPDAWWPPDCRMTGKEGVMLLEAKAGGRLVERNPAGAELLWATVIGVQSGESLDLVGYLAQRYGGPAITLLHLELKEESATTVFRICDSLIGNVSEKLVADVEAGWWNVFGGLGEYIKDRSHKQTQHAGESQRPD